MKAFIQATPIKQPGSNKDGKFVSTYSIVKAFDSTAPHTPGVRYVEVSSDQLNAIMKEIKSSDVTMMKRILDEISVL